VGSLAGVGIVISHGSGGTYSALSYWSAMVAA